MVKMNCLCFFLFVSVTLRVNGDDVSLSHFEHVYINDATNITITFNPSPSSRTVTLAIRTLAGSGDAFFYPGESTSTNVSESCVVEMHGVTASSLSQNMILEAYVDNTVVASNVFTILDKGMIGFEEATHIAQTAIDGQINVAPYSHISTELSNTTYSVMWCIELPEQSLGPDYAALVFINATNGAVDDILIGR